MYLLDNVRWDGRMTQPFSILMAVHNHFAGQVITFVDVSRVSQKGGKEPWVFLSKKSFLGRQIPQPEFPIWVQILAELPPLVPNWRLPLLAGAKFDRPSLS